MRALTLMFPLLALSACGAYDARQARDPLGRNAIIGTALPDLLSAVAAALQASYQPGERVLGSHDGPTLPCRVVRAQPRGDGAADHVRSAGVLRRA